MDVDKNLSLVKTIEKFPCLYKSDTVEYATRNCTDQAWREVSKELKLSVAECKDKWKNLRYGLIRSLRPTRDGCAKKKYYLHEDMAYLIPYIGTGASRCKRKMLLEELEELTNEDRVDDPDPTIQYENDHFEMPNDPESYDDVEDEEPIKKKVKIQYEIRNIRSEQEESRIMSADDDDDSRKMFLLSLLPEIASFSESQMKTFRRRIFGLVDEIIGMELSFNVKSEPL